VHVITGSLLFEPLAELSGQPHNASAAEIKSARMRQMYHRGPWSGTQARRCAANGRSLRLSGEGRLTRWFGATDPEKQKAHRVQGGKAAARAGTAHRFTLEKARVAGAKGGRVTASDREHLAEIGRLGVRARKRLKAAAINSANVAERRRSHRGNGPLARRVPEHGQTAQTE
jgi:hypothetical protein